MSQQTLSNTANNGRSVVLHTFSRSLVAILKLLFLQLLATKPTFSFLTSHPPRHPLRDASLMPGGSSLESSCCCKGQAVCSHDGRSAIRTSGARSRCREAAVLRVMVSVQDAIDVLGVSVGMPNTVRMRSCPSSSLWSCRSSHSVLLFLLLMKRDGYMFIILASLCW